MEKISRETPDLTQENIAKIAALFPDVVTEATDADGNVRLAIDFDALRDDLSGEVVDGPRERYQFTWPGKREAKLEARRPTKKTMRPCPEKSKDWDTTENLYIEGDNLEALKIMRETYAGKVKLIYIDPPYNTRDSRLYRDDYSRATPDYRLASGEYDSLQNRMVTNTETNGRFHSDWCSMMYPRLMLARDLLSEDGVICISIANREVATLKIMADEVFGEKNCLGIIVWESKTKCQNTKTAKRQLQAKQEYILVYRRGYNRHEFRLSVVGARIYDKIDESGSPYRIRKLEEMSASGMRGRETMVFPVLGVMPSDGKQWKFGKQFVDQLEARGDLFLEGGRPAFRCRPEDEEDQYDPFWSLLQTKEVGTAETGKRELDTLLGKNTFDTVKPVNLMKSLIDHVLDPFGKELVMDFFSGSATTAEATMRLNSEDKGNRRFIMVQFPESWNEGTEIVEVANPTLCDLGEERIRRAGEKIRAEADKANEQLELGAEPKPVSDIGFRVLRVDESCLKDEYATPEQYEQAALDLFTDNAAPNATPLDLLFQVLPAFRIEYSAKIVERELGGKTCLDVNDGQLIACFDEDVSTKALEAIAREKPIYAVFRDSSFASDADVANLDELFKTFSPETIRKVI
ncbi:site-specific DNA-methyltransferase [Atopobiaceae bacterium Sow4_H2]